MMRPYDTLTIGPPMPMGGLPIRRDDLRDPEYCALLLEEDLVHLVLMGVNATVASSRLNHERKERGDFF